jgi:uncharacterized protein with ATP-grasp and redox domains
MEIKYDCLPCVDRQFIRLAEKLTDDVNVQKEIIEYGKKVIEERQEDTTVPNMIGMVYAFAKKKTGIIDPYQDEKKECNEIAEKLINRLELRKKIQNSLNPIDTAMRISIAGNIIDFGVGYEIDDSVVQESVDGCLSSELFGTSSNNLMEEINKANKVLFIADNAGEIVFDKLFIESLPQEKITYVVKGGPIVNDAIMEDAISTEMDKLIRVIDTGAAIQGVELTKSSDEFLREFEEADLIISKGQANYESLSNMKDKHIFYLLKAKCQVIAEDIECNQHDYVLLDNFEKYK